MSNQSCFWLIEISFSLPTHQRFYKFYSKMALNNNQDEATRQSINGDSIASYHPESDSILRYILRKNRIYLISVILLFWATLSVYPPLTILIVARNPHISPWDGRFFTTIVCFCLFNLSDMVGRIVASLVPLPDRKSPFLFTISLLRWALIPLLMLCNAQPRSHLPVYFGNETFVVIYVVLLGLSNGYVLMVSIANTAADLEPHMHESNGFVFTLVMGISVVLGSLSSNIILHLL